MDRVYLKGKQCNHVYPFLLTIKDERRFNKKLGNYYVRVSDCEFCGRSEMLMNRDEYPPNLVKDLDTNGLVVRINEDNLVEHREGAKAQLEFVEA